MWFGWRDGAATVFARLIGPIDQSPVLWGRPEFDPHASTALGFSRHQSLSSFFKNRTAIGHDVNHVLAVLSECEYRDLKESGFGG